MEKLSFKAFLEQSENEAEFELLSEVLMDEAFLKAMGDFGSGVLAPFRAIGGAATNLVGQNIKGVGNIAKGALLQGTKGLAQTAVGGLQMATGSGRKGFQNVKAGLGSTAKGIGNVATGAAQIAASPLTAAMRGVQAAGEAGADVGLQKDRNWLQRTFGLNRADQQADVQQQAQEEPKTLRLKRDASGKPTGGYTSKEQPKPQAAPNPQTDQFNRVVRQMQQAIKDGDNNKAKSYRTYLQSQHPDLYVKAVERAKAVKAAAGTPPAPKPAPRPAPAPRSA